MSNSRETVAPGETALDDHRRGRRRRGAELHRAIYDATMDALADAGYANLTMDDVARRARTSKACLYRRWPSRAELVADAVRHLVPDSDDSTDTGDLRGDLIALLSTAAGVLNGPVGTALRGLLADTLRDPELAEATRSRTGGSAPERVMRILRRAAERGEADPAALTHQVAAAGPALLRHHFLVHGTPIPDYVVSDIVDEVVLPLVRVKHNSPDRVISDRVR